MDGSPYPDDFIPRCAGNGPARVFTGPVGKTIRSEAFSCRVADAIRRIKRGQSLNRIRDIHGSIVVRTAVHDVYPTARMVG